ASGGERLRIRWFRLQGAARDDPQSRAHGRRGIHGRREGRRGGERARISGCSKFVRVAERLLEGASKERRQAVDAIAATQEQLDVIGVAWPSLVPRRSRPTRRSSTGRLLGSRSRP